MIRGLLHRLHRWYRLNRGDGRAMLDAGASVHECPRCGRDTPVYETPYSSDGRPLAFSVCIWCDALVEWDGTADGVHEPYARPPDAAGSRAR